MTFACLRGCAAAKKLSREICNSLMRDRWETALVISEDSGVGILATSLRRGDYSIILVPRFLRIFDRVYLCCNDGTASSEIWLPLLSRCRLRSCARARIAIQANATLEFGLCDTDINTEGNEVIE